MRARSFSYSFALTLAGGLVALLAVVAYFPAISSFLVLDDYASVAPLYLKLQPLTPAALWEALWSSNAGPTHRPLAMATFVSQIALAPGSLAHLKVVNIGIHLGVAYVLYRLAREILAVRAQTAVANQGADRWVAGAAAAVWALHPFNVTSVAYTVQRMNSLSALFTALAVLVYIRARGPGPTPGDDARTAFLLALLLLAGMLSKENAALLPVYLLTMEATILRSTVTPLKRMLARPRGKVLAWITATTGLALVVLYIAPSVTGGFDNRPFSLLERLLTESRIVLWYLYATVVPDIASMSLYHDDWTLSRSLWEPLTTLFSVIGLAALVAAGVLLRRRRPLAAFGILWFLGGHLLESTVLPLELIYEHRQYLPAFGIILVVVALFAASVRPRVRSQAPLLVVAVLAAISLATATHLRAQRWSDDVQPRLAHWMEQSGSLRATIATGEIYGKLASEAPSETERAAMFEKAETRFSAAAELRPSGAEPVFGWILLYTQHGREVPDELVTMLHRRLDRGTLSATAINGVAALTNCAVRDRCPSLMAHLPGIYETILEKEKLGAALRNRVLRDWGRYQYLIEQQPQRAIQTLQRASSVLENDIETLLELAYVAGGAGQRNTALQALRRAERLDWLGRKVHTRQQLRFAIMTGSLEPKKDPALQRRRRLR